MSLYNLNFSKRVVYFIVVAFFLLSTLTITKLLISHHLTGKAAQIALAQQYIEIAADIAEGLDKDVYEKFLLTQQDDENRKAIKRYLEQFREPINALYVYVLMLDESDVSKAMVAAIPPGLIEIPIGTACTVPPAQVMQAKKGMSYYTDIIRGEYEGSYLSVGVPFYNDQGNIIGVLGIDISASDLEHVSEEVVSSNAFIFGIDVLFAVALLAAVYVLNKWYKSRLKRDLKETEQIYITELEKITDTIKSSRHDIMNHLHVISGLIDMQMYTEVSDYLKRLKIESQPLDLSLRVKSPILIVLFQSKWELAHSMNIQLEFETDLHDYSRVESFDLVKIYSNLLDNALEATYLYSGEKPKQVRVICKTVGTKYIFAVENTVLLSNEEQKNLFQKGYSTKKSNVSIRGNGLTIVKNTVGKYQGDIYLQYEKEKLLIQITI